MKICLLSMTGECAQKITPGLHSLTSIGCRIVTSINRWPISALGLPVVHEPHALLAFVYVESTGHATYGAAFCVYQQDNYCCLGVPTEYPGPCLYKTLSRLH